MSKWTAITTIVCVGFASSAYASASNPDVAKGIAFVTLFIGVVGVFMAIVSDD